MIIMLSGMIIMISRMIIMLSGMIIMLSGMKIMFMYRRPILCTLYGAVDFLNVLKKYIMYLKMMVICDIMCL